MACEERQVNDGSRPAATRSAERRAVAEFLAGPTRPIFVGDRGIWNLLLEIILFTLM